MDPDMEHGEFMKPGLDGDAVKIAAVSTGDLKARHGSAEYIQGIENQRAMKVGIKKLLAILLFPYFIPLSLFIIFHNAQGYLRH